MVGGAGPSRSPTSRAAVLVVVLGWIAVAALGGCAVGDVTLRPPLARDMATGSRRGEGRQILVIRPFANRRPQARCGMKKNGYNMDTASVHCGRAPEYMLADLLAGQLAAAGFTVLRDPGQAGPSTIVLTGVLEQTFLEPKMNFFTSAFETDISLQMTAKTAAGLVAMRRFSVKGEEATYMASQADMQSSFDSGARQLVTNVVGAVANLADRFPHVAPGTPEVTPPPEPTSTPAPAETTAPAEQTRGAE